MARNDGGSQNTITALSHMNFNESLFFAVGHRAVNVLHQDRECRHRDRFFPRLPNIEADMGDLWISISAPGDRQRAQPLAAEK